MALSIVCTKDERVVSREVEMAVRSALARYGSATLFVGSPAEALRARRSLADAGLAMGVYATTFSSWITEQWELWGDGRKLADSCVLTTLAYELIEEEGELAGPIECLPGNVGVLTRLLSSAEPWLPISGGEANEDEVRRCRLPYGEACFVRLAARLSVRLEEAGYLTVSAASGELVELLRKQGAGVGPFLVSGVSRMQRQEREVVCGLSSFAEVTFVATVVEGPASRQVRELVRELTGKDLSDEGLSFEAGPAYERNHALQLIDDALFGDEPTSCAPEAPVEMLLAAGPVAEPELLAERICELIEAHPGERIVVAMPDVRASWGELSGKFEARHISARAQWMAPLAESESASAFLSFARSIADMDAYGKEWPEPRMGIENEVTVLGDMSWWPPTDIVDFLFQDMAQTDPARVWKIDKEWRSNRLLTPSMVLEMLQKVRYTSEPVAAATRELLRGRVGTAASRLIAPYGKTRRRHRNVSSDESVAVLDAILKLSRTLRSLGIYYNPQKEDSRTLKEVLDLLKMAMVGRSVAVHLGVGPDPAHAQVELMGLKEATRLDGASVDTLIICGLTSVEQPVEGKKGVLEAMLEELEVEPERDALAEARANFRSLIGSASSRLVLERCLRDAEGKECYPSAMLSELMETLGLSATASPENLAIGHRVRSERRLSENLAADGQVRKAIRIDNPAPAGQLTDETRPYVFVPQQGKEPLPENLPVLSASQIETYLECPYKWFSLRRMRLGNVDAGFTPLEMGVTAHRVLELTHTKLLLKALADEQGLDVEGLDDAQCAALLESVAEDPVRHIEGSAVTDANLAYAQDLLRTQFQLHMEHMHGPKALRSNQPLLIPHTSADRAMGARMLDDLVSCLSYQRSILCGFEPRFFEWEFGKGTQLVKYAGAYFTGTVDRIDVGPNGAAVIIDYKNKSAAGFTTEYDALQEGVLEGARLPNRVQSLIYAQVVRRAFEGRLRLVGSVYLSTQAPHALAGVTTASVSERVFGRELRQPRAGRVCVSEGGGSSMDELLDQTEELIAAEVKKMLAGDVEARPRDAKSCEFCPVMQCEKRRAL